MDVTKINYLRTTELQYTYNFPETGGLKDEEKQEIEFNYAITRFLNPEDKIIKVRLAVQGFLHLDEDEKATFSYTTEHFFHVQEFDELSTKNDEGEYLVEDLLDQTLCGLAYSTTRGMLQQKLRDTVFSSFLLPIVKPSELVK